MIENVVLFHVRGTPWTWGGTCVAVALALFVFWLCTLPIVVKRYGSSRPMTTEEVQRRVFLGTDHSSRYVTGEVLAGPAAGRDWAVSFTIGGLRNMRQHADYVQWWLLPAYMMLFLLVFVLGGIGLSLLAKSPFFLAFSGAGVLFMALIAFMMWASVYTQLE